ncbi:hypothetical protein JL722_8826 [Aureococcus anophagefferens]|nr:hypothetical protein JL722_8826 [Aureococcus anophagefferens]
MSIASSAGRHTRVRPAESREPSRNRMDSVNARRAMQEAAIPVTKDMHTAAAVAASPSFMLPEDRRPYREALLRAKVTAGVELRLLESGRVEGTGMERIGLRYHDASYDFCHMMTAIHEQCAEKTSFFAPPEAFLGKAAPETPPEAAKPKPKKFWNPLPLTKLKPLAKSPDEKKAPDAADADAAGDDRAREKEKAALKKEKTFAFPKRRKKEKAPDADKAAAPAAAPTLARARAAAALNNVARYFKDQAFMCSKDEGLEVVFDDFVAQHSGAFADDALARTEGHSFEFTELHEEYLRLFEKATERVLEVCGGTRERPAGGGGGFRDAPVCSSTHLAQRHRA